MDAVQAERGAERPGLGKTREGGFLRHAQAGQGRVRVPVAEADRVRLALDVGVESSDEGGELGSLRRIEDEDVADGIGRVGVSLAREQWRMATRLDQVQE